MLFNRFYKNKHNILSKMNIKHLFLLPLLAGLFGSVHAQDTTYVSTLNSTLPLALRMPVIMQESNMKGEKFEVKELMATDVRLPKQTDFTGKLVAMDHVFEIHPSANDFQVQFFSFQLSSDRYSKGNVQITSPNMLELYIDGKKEGTKSTTEEEAAKAKNLSKTITLMPNQAQNIVIKYFSTSKEENEGSLKVAVFPAKEDSLATLSVMHDGGRFTNIHDDLKGVRVTSTRTSPNGDFALISYRSVDNDAKNTSYTELFNLKNGQSVQIARNNPSWMPTSNQYYYTQTFGNELRLISVNPATMQETVLAENIPTGSFRFAPDESFLIYYDSEENDDRKGDFKLLKSPNDRQPGFLNRYFISKYDLKTGVKEKLTFGKNSTYLNDISPDARYMLISSSEEIITERPFRQSSLFMLDLTTMKMDTLWIDQKFASGGTFSPDMKNVLVTASAEAFDGVGLNIKEGQIANSYDTQVFLFNIGSKKVTPLTTDFNPSVNSARWNKNNGLIYLTVADKDCENVYTYNPKNSRFSKLNLPEDVISSFSIAENTDMATFVGRSMNNPVRAYSYDLKTNKSQLLSDPMKELLTDVKLGEVHDWNFTSSDGTVIEGFYHLPPNFDKNKQYPMIVYYYGGTTPTIRTFEHPYSMHNFAALGYVVYTIQPSGAIGYGQEFSARHVNAWGKRTAEDIIEGTKEFVKQHSFVNAEKIGCVGASYGGFMTMYLQTQTDLFAAAISHAGISALSSYWGEGYWGFSYSSAASAHSYPWNNKKMYVEQSPLFNADKIKTPILLTHGMVDTNVPVGESIQMYTALKILGKPVEFLQVKDENHGIMKQDRRIHWSYSMYAWFDKWLKDQPQWWEALYPEKDK